MAITPLPTAPSRQRPGSFAAEADAFVASLPVFGTEIAALGDEINGYYVSAKNYSDSSMASSQIAANYSLVASSYSNYKGEWASLTGALNIPATVSHSGKLWVLTVNLANVTTSTPGVSSDWISPQSFVNPVFTGSVNEQVYTLIGSTISAGNGTIQTKTLTADTIFTESLTTGQSITLMLNEGNNWAVTWPTITWVSSLGNYAPTLTQKDLITLWKIDTVLYGHWGGSYAAL